jgi:hypothetical protein
MHVSQTVYFRFRHYLKTTDQTPWAEAILPVDSRGGRRLPKLKGALWATPILSYPQKGEKLIVDTDANIFGIGGVLSQVQVVQKRIISYYSKTL